MTSKMCDCNQGRLPCSCKPATVSVDLSELREYHAKAESNLKSYADDSGLRDSDVKHYIKRANFHASMVALIDQATSHNADANGKACGV